MLSFQDGKKADKTDIYITISTFTSVRPSGVSGGSVVVVTSHLQISNS